MIQSAKEQLGKSWSETSAKGRQERKARLTLKRPFWSSRKRQPMGLQSPESTFAAILARCNDALKPAMCSATSRDADAKGRCNDEI